MGRYHLLDLRHLHLLAVLVRESPAMLEQGVKAVRNVVQMLFCFVSFLLYYHLHHHTVLEQFTLSWTLVSVV